MEISTEEMVKITWAQRDPSYVNLARIERCADSLDPTAFCTVHRPTETRLFQFLNERGQCPYVTNIFFGSKSNL